MTEHATPEFRRRSADLPNAVRDSVGAIARSSLADEVDVEQHEMLLANLISLVDAKFGEETRIEMGWCLEQLDDYPIAEWVASQCEGGDVTG
ncbi:MAG TPA: hypothetical protein VGR71_08975 [Nitrospira sp.]|nr:hypothetical protein [Nitrospira sp.]